MVDKIFELDPKEVEKFIRDNILERQDWDLNKYSIKIEWCVPQKEFLAYIEPNLDTVDYQTWTFDGKQITLGEYFKFAWNHWHFTFADIYGRMTGETTFVTEITRVPDDGLKRLQFIYNKEFIDVVVDKDEIYIVEWNKMLHKEVKKPCPEDLKIAAKAVLDKISGGEK